MLECYNRVGLWMAFPLVLGSLDYTAGHPGEPSIPASAARCARSCMDLEGYTEDYLDGTGHLHAGRLAEAIASFDRVPEDSACRVMAQGNIGLALLNMNRHQDAEKQLRQVIERLGCSACPHPPARIQYRRNLGESLVKQHRWVESLEVFHEACEEADRLAEEHPGLAVTIKRGKAHALNSVGAVYLELGPPGRAVDALTLAKEIYLACPSPDRAGEAEALTNLAHALGAVGDKTRAWFALREAFDILSETGDDDQMFRTVIVAEQLGPDDPVSPSVLDLIAEGASQALVSQRPGTAYLPGPTHHCLSIVRLGDRISSRSPVS
ncbi:MAG: tetratricopeptide repeat protein [Gemmataceae bacterium]|nr:tetratricopeptide repeat protein [Gemmataceae bacterium]